MKTHLKDSSEPITEGRSQTAICGTEVKDAAFLLDWDTDVARSVYEVSKLFSMMNCRKCKRHPEPLKGTYVYIITDGQNAKSGEREAAV